MAPSATRPPLRCVVLDAMGVIYEARDDVSELLVPFARSQGSGRTDAEIHEIYRRSSLGELTTAELWQALGVDGAAEELDEAYLRQHRVREGLRGVLEELGRRGLRLACISNDVAQWSRRLRELHGLDRLIPHWTISGEVGARKPDPAIYAAFGRTTGLAYADCVFIDDQPRNLDAAARLGFRTLHFQSVAAGRCCGHEDVQDLSRLAERWTTSADVEERDLGVTPAPLTEAGRVAAIILIGDRVALIERLRNGQQYFLFPGGHLKPGETPEAGLIREVKEKLGLDVTVDRLVAEVVFDGRRQPHYLASVTGGEFGTGTGEEFTVEVIAAHGTYAPILVPIDDLLSVPLRPRAVAELIVRSRERGWPARPIAIEDASLTD